MKKLLILLMLYTQTLMASAGDYCSPWLNRNAFVEDLVKPNSVICAYEQHIFNSKSQKIRKLVFYVDSENAKQGG